MVYTGGGECAACSGGGSGIWDCADRIGGNKQVAAVTAGSRLGAVLVVAGRASSKNVFVFGIVVHCMIT